MSGYDLKGTRQRNRIVTDFDENIFVVRGDIAESARRNFKGACLVEAAYRDISAFIFKESIDAAVFDCIGVLGAGTAAYRDVLAVVDNYIVTFAAVD